MRISLKSLECGRHDGEQFLNFDYDLDLSGIERWGARPFPLPVKISGAVSDRAGVITVRYKAVFAREEPCARCLKPVRADIASEFSHIIAEAEDADGAEDFISAHGGFLDMDELALSDILLSQDGTSLCNPDCRGLCPKCGVDLNENTCSCALSEPDPRFAKLAQFIY